MNNLLLVVNALVKGRRAGTVKRSEPTALG
jgi:hypothetical protein